MSVPGGQVTEAGVRDERQRRAPVPRQLAARQRRGGDQQPHGGRRDRRDLPLPALAVAGQRLGARRRAGRRRGAAAPASQEELAKLGGPDVGRLETAAELLDDLVLADDFADFLTLRAYPRLG